MRDDDMTALVTPRVLHQYRPPLLLLRWQYHHQHQQPEPTFDVHTIGHIRVSDVHTHSIRSIEKTPSIMAVCTTDSSNVESIPVNHIEFEIHPSCPDRSRAAQSRTISEDSE